MQWKARNLSDSCKAEFRKYHELQLNDKLKIPPKILFCFSHPIRSHSPSLQLSFSFTSFPLALFSLILYNIRIHVVHSLWSLILPLPFMLMSHSHSRSRSSRSACPTPSEEGDVEMIHGNNCNAKNNLRL
jgi:hypothetical protein